MNLSPVELENQKQLKSILQGDEASKFETLVAALIEELLNLPIYVAGAGFQYGGDAGPAGGQGRKFRIECKKYGDRTGLRRRELLGEIDHALERDENIEAWILASTRDVKEELAQDLVLKGEKCGLSVIILDWNNNDLSPIAALCASYPDVVARFYSPETAEIAKTLSIISKNAIAVLDKNLQSWCIGYEMLRNRSHRILQSIWDSPTESNAILGQNVSGGAIEKKITRYNVEHELDTWWQGSDQDQSKIPAAVIGLDGVGKTWAVTDWLVNNIPKQPVVLIFPSSEVASISGMSKNSVKKLIAAHLHEMTGVRSCDYWLNRINSLLERPPEEGAAFTLFFDGLNQEPSIDWVLMLKILQAEPFSRRVRVIVSTRNHHYEEKLSSLRGLIIRPQKISVDVYDKNPGGELEQMLLFEKLSRTDLHPDIVELARIPRLFKLVINFRKQLVDANQVTIHRLLWEYGRDTFGERAGKSFSETEWRDYLKQVAKSHRKGIKEYSLKDLGEMASSPDLTKKEIYIRLSDIIDGHFIERGKSGELYLNPTLTAHALGSALLAYLDTIHEKTFNRLENELSNWLDPISGFDQKSEILRAAVSILVERETINISPMAGVLVTAWLQSQNINDSHRLDLSNLAPVICNPLLDAIENSSNSQAYSSARIWAVRALRSIPRNDDKAFQSIVERSLSWLRIVSLGINPRDKDDKKIFKKRFENRIGRFVQGNIAVLGVEMELVEYDNGRLRDLVPTLMDGFPLHYGVAVFESAAISVSISGDVRPFWKGLRWICILNGIDPNEMASEIDRLANDILKRPIEEGICSDLPAEIASGLFWMSGREEDEEKAVSIDPGIDKFWNYEKDYLLCPSKSIFPLERRHADIALNDIELPIQVRIQISKDFWLDPEFSPTPSFVSEIQAFANKIEISKLDAHSCRRLEDHEYDEIEPVLARCAPELLINLVRKKVEDFSICPVESRYWKALHARDCFLFAGKKEAGHAKILRLNNSGTPENQECFAATNLLMIEIMKLNALDQFEKIIDADLKYLDSDFENVIKHPNKKEIDQLIKKYGNSPLEQKGDLLILLSVFPITISEYAWDWLIGQRTHVNLFLRGIIFEILSCANPKRLGMLLLEEGWSWDSEFKFEENHYGSEAIIEAARDIGFEEILPRLAPWQILKAARIRGEKPDEIQLAAENFESLLQKDDIHPPDLEANLSLKRCDNRVRGFLYSVSLLSDDDIENDFVTKMKRNLDMDAHINALSQATEKVRLKVRKARKSGARLYLRHVTVEDLLLIFKHEPSKIKRWLKGLNRITDEFKNRVLLAEDVYVNLCEILLKHDPPRGATLWSALNKILRTNIIGAADIKDSLHMLFRVPESPEVLKLRKAYMDLSNCNTDEALFDLAVAAGYNKKSDWLLDVIKADRNSDLPWRQKRGLILKGFMSMNTLPVPNAWPEGKITTGYKDLEYKSERFRFKEASARHWFRIYLKSETLFQAYAAWILFLRSADRRAWIWVQTEIDSADDDSEFFDLKIRHLNINMSKLKNHMKEQTKKLNERFLGRDTLNSISPWRNDG